MTTKDRIEVLQAFDEGKKIQTREFGSDEWRDITAPDWDFSRFNYRIKPEVEYRPYKDYHEMIADFCERFGINRSNYAMPSIWLKSKTVDYVFMANCFTGNKDGVKNLEFFFREYDYLDGSPVGRKVDECE